MNTHSTNLRANAQIKRDRTKKTVSVILRLLIATLIVMTILAVAFIWSNVSTASTVYEGKPSFNWTLFWTNMSAVGLIWLVLVLIVVVAAFLLLLRQAGKLLAIILVGTIAFLVGAFRVWEFISMPNADGWGIAIGLFFGSFVIVILSVAIFNANKLMPWFNTKRAEFATKAEARRVKRENARPEQDRTFLARTFPQS